MLLKCANMATLSGMPRNLLIYKRVCVTTVILFCLLGLCLGVDTFFGGSEDVCESDDCQKMEPAGMESPKIDDSLRTSDVLQNAESEEINVIITFTNAARNHNLQKKFAVTVTSLLQHSSVPLALHIIGEEESQNLAARIVQEKAPESNSYRFVKLDVDHLAREMQEVITPMQHHFSYKPGAYYNHALFFLSIAMHRVMPETMHRVIMLDADLKFKADIKELYTRFELFTNDNVLGIGRDLQPVYRHAFHQYRRQNPGTRVGDPPPDGLTGFNSGILLLDLDRMRKSKLYNSLINPDVVDKLTKKFFFKGHLGDQDFFSLLSMEYEQLFHILPCEWNRQLCQWWRDKGYESVFHLYYNCTSPAKIYHGNCNTPIPDD